MRTTASPTPWSTRATNAGTQVLDALGRVIGTFADWRDAEACLSQAYIHERLDRAYDAVAAGRFLQAEQILADLL